MLGKELLNLKGSKLSQILRADKTGFRRLGHICCFYTYPTIVRHNYDYITLTFSAHYHM